MTARLLDEKNLTEAGKAYQAKRRITTMNLSMPPIWRSQCSSGLSLRASGSGRDREGEKHADYAEAKQNILYAADGRLHGYE